MDIPEKHTEVPRRNLKGNSEAPENTEVTWLQAYDLYKEWKLRTGYLTKEEEPKERKESKLSRRGWFMTINNPTLKDFKALHQDDYTYCMGQIEVGDSGTAHIQCMVYYKNSRVCPIKKYPRAFIEPCKSITASILYCSDPHTRVLGPWSFGEMPQQGRRRDLEQIRDEILNGETNVNDILIRDPLTYHEFGRTLTKLEDYKMSQLFRTEMTLAIWFVGETGTGKSHRAFTGYSPKTHYKFPYDGQWWDNYRQQPIVVFNEFRGDSQVPFATMLELIDKFPVEVRRRNRPPMPFTSKLIIITSPLTPGKVFGRIDKDDNFDQFKRRVKVVRLDKKYSDVKEPEIDDINNVYKLITGSESITN